MWKKALIIVLYLAVIAGSTWCFRMEEEKDSCISVELKGAVEEEKVCHVEIGTTLEEILQKAVLKEDADLSALSLQEILYDGEIVVIPYRKEYKLISINTAGIEELSLLPGIGPLTAQKIVEYRETYGSFHDTEELKNVKGIGDKKYEKLRAYVCL